MTRRPPGHRRAARKIARFIRRWSLVWYSVTTFLYFAAIPFTLLVYPATTLILTVIVLFGGFTSSMASFASAIADEEAG